MRFQVTTDDVVTRHRKVIVHVVSADAVAHTTTASRLAAAFPSAHSLARLAAGSGRLRPGGRALVCSERGRVLVVAAGAETFRRAPTPSGYALALSTALEAAASRGHHAVSAAVDQRLGQGGHHEVLVGLGELYGELEMDALVHVPPAWVRRTL